MPVSARAATKTVNHAVEPSTIMLHVVKHDQTDAQRDRTQEEDHGREQEFHIGYPTQQTVPTALSAGTVTNSWGGKWINRKQCDRGDRSQAQTK